MLHSEVRTLGDGSEECLRFRHERDLSPSGGHWMVISYKSNENNDIRMMGRLGYVIVIMIKEVRIVQNTSTVGGLR
jgi:hypothetical protein